MEKGSNYNTKYILNYIGEDKLAEINEYIEKVSKEDFYEFKSREEIEDTLKDFIATYNSKISYEDKEYIKNYTGLSFRRVNSLLRGYWDYEKSGALKENDKKEIYELSKHIRESILKAPQIPGNIKTYRGVNLNTFRTYGIKEMADLKYLQGNFFYDAGFTSTSLINTNSFYNKQPEWGYDCNVEITYYIPAESDDGIVLTEELSYSASQTEFLINNSSLFYIFDVFVDEKQNKAKVKMILITERLWNNKDYEIEHGKILK